MGASGIWTRNRSILCRQSLANLPWTWWGKLLALYYVHSPLSPMRWSQYFSLAHTLCYPPTWKTLPGRVKIGLYFLVVGHCISPAEVTIPIQHKYVSWGSLEGTHNKLLGERKWARAPLQKARLKFLLSMQKISPGLTTSHKSMCCRQGELWL